MTIERRICIRQRYLLQTLTNQEFCVGMPLRKRSLKPSWARVNCLVVNEPMRSVTHRWSAMPQFTNSPAANKIV